MQKSFIKNIIPLFSLFVVIDALLLWYQKDLPRYHIDAMVVFAANTLLFILSVLSLMMHTKAIDKKNPNAAIRGVMGATVLKLFVLGAAALVYLFLCDQNSRSLNAIFVGMILYVVYTFIEVRIASKANQEK
jgi:hypothetical protein